mmetsp:Transcript_1667/g.3732  ORF Transcript_1667/g.3732 Transcript_1667/m.3732 type:complete len:539 (-) Transcript_1667:759-2375(-)|eukprot:CAMPEP_0202921360 /NCGR_PEP_ID=MMETSP1392-20130828/77350_1 /ASSEMBLY_ACC=CAM_ASM_000868 /TAXON_ID=225041 /ORGANISM="Chlamydomonas chlamydogama, Strain SAG 11-48b" /LENGTH=538 /DNA_ID=CAMNT_0049614927 /DNA_START=127 /DNA_END=1743 /DNA_ORIENTATION=-
MSHHWLSEAVVDFLRGPLYINPLMAFIDEKCLIFTPEDENKLEYTVVHDQFKKLVDELLTDFLAELGVSPETFFDIVSSEQNQDKLTSFVVQTILTVDDFLMFKAMMVKRNVDLTNQVLAAVGELQDLAVAVDPSAASITSKATDEEARLLAEALRQSESVNAQEMRIAQLRNLMRSLQLEDEDVAMVIAIANSLRDQATAEAELADLEQAIALSMALEAEQRRLLKEGGAAATSSAATSSAAGGLQHRPFPAADKGSAASGPGYDPLRPIDARSSVTAEPLAPLKIGPNTAADQMAAVAAAAEANARALAAAMSGDSSAQRAAGGDVVATARKGIEELKLSGGGAAGSTDASSKFSPAPLNLPPGARPLAGSMHPGQGRFVPLPLNLDGPKKPSEDVPSPGNLILGEGRAFATQGSVRNRGAGYKANAAGGVDLSAVRQAAQQAAETQKHIIASRRGGEGGDDAQRWLQEQKVKLVEKKRAERAAETEAYKAEKGVPRPPMGLVPPTQTGEDLEVKRAALRDKLAQKFKQELVKQNT